ncbi:phage tail tube protein, partial [Streptomyces sp. NPDC002644]
WSILYGMQSFNKSTTPTDQDDSDFEDGGWKSSARTAQQWTASATVLVKKDSTGAALDPVHAKLQAAGRALGEAAKVKVRVSDREGLEDPEIVTVLVTWEASGEGVEDLGTADLTLTGCGAPTVEATP